MSSQQALSRFNNTYESRHNNEWPQVKRRFDNASFETSRNTSSRILTPPPPPLIDWSTVVDECSTNPNLEKTNNVQNRLDAQDEEMFKMDDQYVRYKCAQNPLSIETADKYGISMDRRDGNTTSWQLEEAKGEFWRSDNNERQNENRYPERRESVWKCDSPFQSKIRSNFEENVEFCNIEVELDIDDNSFDIDKVNYEIRKVKLPEQKERFPKFELDFQNIFQVDLKANQEMCSSKIEVQSDEDDYDESTNQDLEKIRNFLNSNYPEFKSMRGFGSLESSNDNNRRNDQPTNKDWEFSTIVDAQKNNIFADTFLNQSRAPSNKPRVDMMNFENTAIERFFDRSATGGFRNLETSNGNSLRNGHTNNKERIFTVTDDTGKNNITVNTFLDQSSEFPTKSSVDVMNLDNISDNDGINCDEERVDVRIIYQEKVQCVSMTLKQYERYKKALSLGFRTCEALDFSAKGLKKIGIVPSNLGRNPLSFIQMQQIENIINNYAAKWSYNTNLISCHRQNGWLIMLCNSEILEMLQSQFTVVRNICKLDIKLVNEGEHLFPPGHIVHGYFPRSINYHTSKVLELIQTQNNITTTLWKPMKRKVEQGLVLNITFEVDDDSWQKLQSLNGSIFYRFGQITLSLEKTDSLEERNRIEYKPSTTVAYSKKISKPTVRKYGNTGKTQSYIQNIQNVALTKSNDLRSTKDLNRNMNRVHQQSTTMAYTSNFKEISESLVRDNGKPRNAQSLTKSNQLKSVKNVTENLSRGYQQSTTTACTNNTSQITQSSVQLYGKTEGNTPSIPNTALMKINQFKKEIASNMKLLQHKRALEEEKAKQVRNVQNFPPVLFNQPEQIQNEKFRKLNQLKQNIDAKLKLLEHSRSQSYKMPKQQH